MCVITNGASITCSFVRIFPIKCTAKQKKPTDTFFSQGTNNYESLNPCVQFELQAHFAEVQAHICNKIQRKAQLPRTEPRPLQNLWFQIQRAYLCKQCIFISPTVSKHQGICTDVRCY